MTSLSARRAWIEIILPPVDTTSVNVALRKESVDRNIPSIGTLRNTHNVALRKESVDRNFWWVEGDRFFYYVALRKESVDRNTSIDNLTQGVFKSLSARRAWIEMLGWLRVLEVTRSLSARRAWIEIIDDVSSGGKIKSLSARRAWIEI